MKKIGVVLILFGFAMVFAGIAIKRSNTNDIYENTTETSESNLHDQENEDALSFINFVSGRLSQRYFTITFLESETKKAPAELMVEYELKGKSGKFFLRTQWHRRYQHNEIEVATSQEIIDYQSYSKEFNEALFKIIGIGGLPSKPKLLYIIPVEDIVGTTLTINEISKFIKDDQSAFFFFDSDDKTLK